MQLFAFYGRKDILRYDNFYPFCFSLINKTVIITGRRRRLKIQRIGDGLCYECGEEKTNISYPLCERHALMLIARKYLGAKKEWKALKELLEKQGRRCYYTGAELYIGINAVVDFIEPGKPVFCLKRIAQAKDGLTLDAYAVECEQVCRKLKPELFR